MTAALDMRRSLRKLVKIVAPTQFVRWNFILKNVSVPLKVLA